MPAIRNTKKALVECLLLKQESVKDKSFLERIRMDPTLSTKLYNKLIEADLCWHKVDDFYFSETIIYKGVQKTPRTHPGSHITILY